MATHQKTLNLTTQKKKKSSYGATFQFRFALPIQSPLIYYLASSPRLASPIIPKNTKVTKRNQMKLLIHYRRGRIIVENAK